jgi:predicted DNA-binding antitoxin AbrB/MazE fold protein
MIPKTIKVIYEDGVLKPLEKLEIPEHEKVEIIIPNDIPSSTIAQSAEDSRSFDFLKEPVEDIYSLEDGEEI